MDCRKHKQQTVFQDASWRFLPDAACLRYARQSHKSTFKNALPFWNRSFAKCGFIPGSTGRRRAQFCFVCFFWFYGLAEKELTIPFRFLFVLYLSYLQEISA